MNNVESLFGSYLHNHTMYSNIRLLDSINKPKDLLKRAFELNSKGIAITEHECLSSHIKFITEYKKLLKDNNITEQDFKLILGNEIYLVDNVKEIKNNYNKEEHGYWHFILLAKNKKGYRLLKRASSTAWHQSYFQRRMERVPIEKEQLKQIIGNEKGNLIGSTACLGGELSNLILKREKNLNNDNLKKYYEIKIENFLNYCIEIFGKEDFYLEIQPSHNKEQKIVNSYIKELSKLYNLKIIVTTDSHYLNKEDRYIHKAYLNSKDGEREVDDFYETTYLIPFDEIYNEYLKEEFTLEEYKTILNNTNEISNKCEFYDLFHKQIIPEWNVEEDLNRILNKHKNIIDFKAYETLNSFMFSDNIQNKYYFWKCYDGLCEKVLSKEEKKKNLDKYLIKWETEAKTLKDISPILEQDMTKYYNTMKFIMDLVWTEGDSLIGPGRGSANGFLSCYLMDITQDDPVVYNLPSWRHLDVTRPELPDIDFDSESLKRDKILKALKTKLGYYNVLNIATFGTEKPRSATLTACRGYRSKEYPNGIDVDIAQYLSSMIPKERGIDWTLEDCFYGNEEKNRKPVLELISEVEKFEGLKDIMFAIEGIINKRGIHASGVYIFNNGFIDYNALMKAPNGKEITQFDMSDSDYQGCLKYDFLTVEALDKIRNTLDLLIKFNYIEKKENLKETYNYYLHPDVLNYSNEKMWEKLGNNEIIDAFQMNTTVGQEALKKIQPKNLIELAHTSSLMRLMGEEGKINPIDKYVKYKQDISLWYKEMDNYNLTKNEQTIFEKYLLQYYGVAATQEDVMRIVMEKDLCNLSLKEANKVRKAIAKKKASMIDEIKDLVYSRSLNENIFNYIWNEIIKPQLGYSFSINHTTPYAMICIQEMNLYYFYPSVFWNTACLTSSAAISSKEEEEENFNEINNIENNIYNELEFLDDEDEDEILEKKKKNSSTNYDKIAVAIGEIQSKGIKISLPDINKSIAEFTPDIENNMILYGLKGISNVSEDTIEQIISNRPFLNFDDFLLKVKINKTIIINLIKAGCFDKIENLSRKELMEKYIKSISGLKNTLNLRNFQGLNKFNLLPNELDDCKYTFLMNKYLKENKYENYYIITEELFPYFENAYGSDFISIKNNLTLIEQKVWDKNIYQIIMDKARNYIKANLDILLEEYNKILFLEQWNKYCLGNYSKWEMDSVSFYFSEHELNNINYNLYGLKHFSELNEEPKPIKFFKHYPIYKIEQIAGTVLSKNKIKSTITLLDSDGSVILVKFRKEYFNLYDKQISILNSDGTKKIIEKSWFKRGNKLIIAGYRRENEFIPKTYSTTPFKTLYNIIEITENNNLSIKDERFKG